MCKISTNINSDEHGNSSLHNLKFLHRRTVAMLLSANIQKQFTQNKCVCVCDA